MVNRSQQKHDSSTSRESKMPEGQKLLKRIVATEKGLKQHVHRAETRALPTKILLWALYHHPPSWLHLVSQHRLRSPCVTPRKNYTKEVLHDSERRNVQRWCSYP